MSKRDSPAIILALLIIGSIFVTGCNSSGGFEIPAIPNPHLNIPITRAPDAFIDPHATPAPAPVNVTSNSTANQTNVTPVSTYKFVYV